MLGDNIVFGAGKGREAGSGMGVDTGVGVEMEVKGMIGEFCRIGGSSSFATGGSIGFEMEEVSVFDGSSMVVTIVFGSSF